MLHSTVNLVFTRNASQDTIIESLEENSLSLTKEFIERETSRDEIAITTEEPEGKCNVNGDINFIKMERENSNESDEVKCDTPELERKTFLLRLGECCSGNCFTAFSNEVPAEETAEAILDQIERREILPVQLG